MNWLRDNASAIQAFSSLAALAVAVILATLTAKYVRLTKELATAAIEQVKTVREISAMTRKQSALALSSLSRRLFIHFSEFNVMVPEFQQLKRSSQLTERDLNDLTALARAVAPECVVVAANLEQRLRVLLRLIESVKPIPDGAGWTPTISESEEYRGALASAVDILAELEDTAYKHAV